MLVSRGFAVAVLTVLAVGLAGTARADAIDGDWCKAGRQFTIDGPEITTPAGTVTHGNYDRHAFHYVDEDGGFDAGASVYMRLLDEETLILAVGSPGPDGEIWQRCDFTS